jgi:hypothetical protein
VNRDSDEGFVFDEDFVKAATVMEPTARKRRGNAVTRWWRQRRRRRAMVKAWREPRRTGKARSRVLAVLLIGGLLATAVTLQRADLFGAAARGAAPAQHVPLPADILSSPASGSGPGDPFAGSPAEAYADGEYGITFPAARPTAGFPTQTVQLLYLETHALITSGYLDSKTLFGGSTAAFGKLLDPEQRKDLTTHLRRWVVSFAPGTAELSGTVVKVHGETTLTAATRQGNRGVLITVNYLFVYPVHEPGRPGSTVRVISHLRGEVFHYRDATGERTWLWTWGASHTNVRCDVKDDYVHPFYADSSLDKVGPSGAPIDPYDLARTDSFNGYSCQRASRT